MKIYIPSYTYTGKPIAYFEDGEKEDLDKMIDLEENYRIEDGVLFKRVDSHLSRCLSDNESEYLVIRT